MREDGWPWPPGAPVRATLAHGGQPIVPHDAPAGTVRPFGLTGGFEPTKKLDSAGQFFVPHAQRFTGPSGRGRRSRCAPAPARWPGSRDVGWRPCRRAPGRGAGAPGAHVAALHDGRAGRGHRPEPNRPINAVLASTQTALRLLRERQLVGLMGGGLGEAGAGVSKAAPCPANGHTVSAAVVDRARGDPQMVQMLTAAGARWSGCFLRSSAQAASRT